jgi:hypothetical protein
LKERLLEANCEVDQQLDELIELINLKKQELFTIIDEIAAENVLNNNQNLKSAKITLESMSTDHSILELSKNLILEDVSKMVYSEKTAPSISKDLETSLKTNLIITSKSILLLGLILCILLSQVLNLCTNLMFYLKKKP